MYAITPSAMSAPAGAGGNILDEIRKRRPEAKIQEGLDAQAARNRGVAGSLGIKTDAAGNQVRDMPPRPTNYDPMPSPAARPAAMPTANGNPPPSTMPDWHPSMAAPPVPLPSTGAAPMPVTVTPGAPTPTRPALPPIGRGMNGGPALSETRFGTGMNGEPNPVAASYSKTSPQLPGAMAGSSGGDAGGEYTKYVESALKDSRVKFSGIGMPRPGGGVRSKGPRGARRGDTMKGGRFNGQLVDEVQSRLRGEFAAGAR